MSCVCDLKIEFKGKASDLIPKIRAMILIVGGTFNGDDKSGSFSVPVLGSVIKGTYTITGQTAEICLTAKPFFLTCKVIEDFIKAHIPTIGAAAMDKLGELLPQADVPAQAGTLPPPTACPPCPPTYYQPNCCTQYNTGCYPYQGAQPYGHWETSPWECPPTKDCEGGGAQAQNVPGITLPMTWCLCTPYIPCAPQGAQAQAATPPPLTHDAACQFTQQFTCHPTGCMPTCIVTFPCCPPQGAQAGAGYGNTYPTFCIPTCVTKVS